MLQGPRPVYLNAAQFPQLHQRQPVANNLQPIHENLVFNNLNQGAAPHVFAPAHPAPMEPAPIEPAAFEPAPLEPAFVEPEVCCLIGSAKVQQLH